MLYDTLVDDNIILIFRLDSDWACLGRIFGTSLPSHGSINIMRSAMFGTGYGKSNRVECSQLTGSSVEHHLGLFDKLVRTLMCRNMSIGETCELDMTGVKQCHLTGIERSYHN